MALTLATAFQEFRENIDLTSTDSTNAKNSRTFLVDEIRTKLSKDGVFPNITGDFYNYGSFSRKTKLRPLNDVDFMVKISAGKTSLIQSYPSHIFRIKVTDTTSPLYRFTDSSGDYVSSVKVLNAMKDSIQNHHVYRRSLAVRNQQAVILNLTSYTWSFDIVPAIGVSGSDNSTAYFLIPDGNSNWLQTDPRVDASRTSNVNQKHDSKLLAIIRMLKHWNKRGGKTSLRSFHFETLVLNVFDYAPKITSERNAIKYFFDNAGTYILLSCISPNGYGPNLDSYLTQAERNGIITAINRASGNITLANLANLNGDNKSAIGYWRLVFGDPFPIYG